MTRHQVPRSVGLAVIALCVTSIMLACQTQPAAPAPTTAPAAPAKAAAAQPAAPTQGPAPGATQAPPAAATQAPAQVKTIKLGVAHPRSGPAAASGINVERWLSFAIEDINAKGIKVGNDTYRMEMIVADDKYSAEAGRESANKLVLADKVDFFYSSGPTPLAGALAVTEPVKMLTMVTASTETLIGKDHPLVLASYINRQRSIAVYDWLVKNNPSVKRVTILGSDDGAGQSAAAISQDLLKQKGLTLIAKEMYPPDIKDLMPLATRVVRENPDAIDLGGGAGVPTFLKAVSRALYDVGYRKLRYASAGDTGVAKSGDPSLEGFTFAFLADHKASQIPAGQKALIQRFIQKWGESELSFGADSGYSLVMVLAQAIEKAGTIKDTDKILQAMREGEWDTIWGKLRFGGAKTYGLPSVLDNMVYLSSVQNGKVDTLSGEVARLP